jgi:hypothetical protein
MVKNPRLLLFRVLERCTHAGRCTSVVAQRYSGITTNIFSIGDTTRGRNRGCSVAFLILLCMRVALTSVRKGILFNTKEELCPIFEQKKKPFSLVALNYTTNS